MKRRFLVALITLLLMVNLAFAVYASHEVPDLTKNGTITITLDWNGEPLNGGALKLVQVGVVVEEDGNYSFACVEALEPVSLDNLSDPALAAELADAAATAGLEAVSAPIADGKAVFTDVAPGLYVVIQGSEDVTDGFAALSPFLISMPRFEDGHYETNVMADPKVPLETAPTEPTVPSAPTDPTSPDGPNIPQTGQLNWPVPLLAALGLTFFVIGWILCFGPDRRNKKR